MTDEPLVPEGAEVHGGWQMTPFGRTRVLKWGNISPELPDENGEYEWLLRIVARQHATGHIDTFEIEIGPAAHSRPARLRYSPARSSTPYTRSRSCNRCTASCDAPR